MENLAQASGSSEEVSPTKGSRSTAKRSGATVEGMTQGYPHNGPIPPLGQGWAELQDSIKDPAGYLMGYDVNR